MDENTYRRSFVRKKPVLDPGKRNMIIVNSNMNDSA